MLILFWPTIENQKQGKTNSLLNLALKKGVYTENGEALDAKTLRLALG